MPHNREWQDRIKAVEREYVAMRQAADRFRQAALADPTILEGNLRQREMAARRELPDTQRDNAHLVREYRNALVHEREEKPEEVPIAVARGHLCHFFSFLPLRW